MSVESFQKLTPVSRETLTNLKIYANLLKKWQAKINLVGSATIDELWTRHMLDSAQLYSLLKPDVKTLVDLGSGAGFPGLVLAIMGVPDVHLVESDIRKSTFLREVARQTKINITIHNKRIEDVKPFPADVVTARALANLKNLLGYAERFHSPNMECLFLKGKMYKEELEEAKYVWHIIYKTAISQTSDESSIIIVEDFKHVCTNTQQSP
jgi:16S rRNA (guanine527-N7)-methyltransferase